MIYESKERAVEVAKMMNRVRWTVCPYVAIRTVHGWTIRLDSPYSLNGVLEVA